MNRYLLLFIVTCSLFVVYLLLIPKVGPKDISTAVAKYGGDHALMSAKDVYNLKPDLCDRMKYVPLALNNIGTHSKPIRFVPMDEMELEEEYGGKDVNIETQEAANDEESRGSDAQYLNKIEGKEENQDELKTLEEIETFGENQGRETDVDPREENVDIVGEGEEKRLEGELDAEGVDDENEVRPSDDHKEIAVVAGGDQESKRVDKLDAEGVDDENEVAHPEAVAGGDQGSRQGDDLDGEGIDNNEHEVAVFEENGSPFEKQEGAETDEEGIDDGNEIKRPDRSDEENDTDNDPNIGRTGEDKAGKEIRLLFDPDSTLVMTDEKRIHNEQGFGDVVYLPSPNNFGEENDLDNGLLLRRTGKR